MRGLARAAVIFAGFSLLLGAPSQSPRAATASCPQGTTLNIVAHEDDDLIFLSPDLLHDVEGDRCVVTVFASAGDAGQGPLYWQGREDGAQAAYALMAGVDDSWTIADAGIAGHPAPKLTLTDDPTVSLIFLRLPDGWPNGAGTVLYGNESLEKLWNGSIAAIEAVDGTSSYTRQELIGVFAGLMDEYQPDTIRTTDYLGAFGDGDHSDHHAVARFANAAQLSYASAHTITGYIDYLVSALPQNVFGADLNRKRDAFFAYAAHDPLAGAQNWIERQYTLDSAAIAFSATSYSIGESGLSAQVMIRRFGDTESGIAVGLTTSGVSATPGSDFTPVDQLVSFAPGQTSKVVSIPIIDDSLIEGGETISISLSDPGLPQPPLALGSPATLTILDNDSATIALSQASYSLEEGAGEAQIMVLRAGAMDSSISVRLTTANGSAAAGSDYTSVDETVVFGPGIALKIVSVPVSNDGLIEGDESLTLSLSAPSAGTSLVSPSAATLTIRDDDTMAIGFSAASYSVGEAAAAAQVAVVRSGAMASTASVVVATAGGSASGGSDYTFTSQTLSFAAGEISKIVAIPILDDALIEGDETVSLSLSFAGSPPAGVVLGVPTLLTIKDDDVAAVSFSQSGFSVAEAGGGARVSIRRSGALASAVSVRVATTGGASAGADYTPVSQVVLFGAGETAGTISIPILPDDLAEGDEKIALALSSPSAGTNLVSPSTATLTILDDDAPTPPPPPQPQPQPPSPDPDPVGQAGAATSPERPLGKIASARLSPRNFKKSRAAKVRLELRFLPSSSSFSYSLKIRRAGKWRKVRSVEQIGSFSGTRILTVRSLFARKAIARGKYRLTVSADANSKTLIFRIS